MDLNDKFLLTQSGHSNLWLVPRTEEERKYVLYFLAYCTVIKHYCLIY